MNDELILHSSLTIAAGDYSSFFIPHSKFLKMENTRFKISQYACAVLLIVSSIAMVAYQVVEVSDVASGLLYYVAQSFLLAGSIFGLDQYVRIIKRQYHEKHSDQ
jgi:hypothetical protein